MENFFFSFYLFLITLFQMDEHFLQLLSIVKYMYINHIKSDALD